MTTHTDSVRRYLSALYCADRRQHACTATTPDEVAAWQRTARPALRRLLGLEEMAAAQTGHTPGVDLGAPEDLGDCTRQPGVLRSEAHVEVPFWLLRPRSSGPYPVGIFPHGHEQRGLDIYAGVYASSAKREHALSEDRDVAVQAARRGYLAIAPTTRGFQPAAVPDLNERHGGRHCRSQLIHCLLAGRTALGERAVAGVRAVYAAAGVPGRYVHRWGHAGHRFYADLMWPCIDAAMETPPAA